MRRFVLGQCDRNQKGNSVVLPWTYSLQANEKVLTFQPMFPLDGGYESMNFVLQFPDQFNAAKATAVPCVARCSSHPVCATEAHMQPQDSPHLSTNQVEM